LKGTAPFSSILRPLFRKKRFLTRHWQAISVLGKTLRFILKKVFYGKDFPFGKNFSTTLKILCLKPKRAYKKQNGGP